MKKLIYLFSILFICSCTTSYKTDAIVEIKGYETDILPNGDELTAEAFHIIPLETTPECLISDIYKVEFADSLIFVECNEGLFCFNHAGKFKYTVGRKGNGPGEYLRINTFFINSSRKEVCIIDGAANKMKVYNISGVFTTDISFSSDATDLCHWNCMLTDNDLLCANYIYNDMNTIYSLWNIETDTYQPLYQFPVKSDNTAEYISKHPISVYKDAVKMIIPFDNTIYCLENSELNPFATVKTNMPLVSQDMVEKIDAFGIMTYAQFFSQGYFTGFTGIFETDKYLLLQVLFGMEYFLIDKETNIGKLYTCSVKDSLVENLPLLKIIAVEDDFFVGVEEAENLKELADNISEPILDKNLKYLKEISHSLLYDDNPCLLLYKLK